MEKRRKESKSVLLLWLWVFCLHAYLHTTYLPGTLRGQKRVLDSPWKWSHRHVSAGNGIPVVWKSSPVLLTSEPSLQPPAHTDFLKKLLPGVAYVFDPSHHSRGRDRWISKFEASLVYPQ